MKRIGLAIHLACVVLATGVSLAAAGDAPMLDLGPEAGEATGGADPNASPPTKSDGTGAEKPAAGQGGRIEGAILPARRVRSVSVVEREAGLQRAAQYDRTTGKFAAHGLPPGNWAVEVETTWGLIQGVDMRFRPGKLRKLIPEKARQLDPKPPGPLDDEDRAEIARHVTGPERFMTARPLLFAGDARRATVLVNLLRDRPFHGSKPGEVVWRLEVWYYEDQWGHWERLGGRVVFRHRMSNEIFRTWTRQFEPRLGGLEITAETADPIVVTCDVPELPDPARGLVAEGQKAAPPAAGPDGGAAPPKVEPAPPPEKPPASPKDSPVRAPTSPGAARPVEAPPAQPSLSPTE